MIKRQVSTKDMYIVLRALIATISTGVIASMPSFDSWYAQWNDIVDTLCSLIEIQKKGRKGKAVVKAERRALLSIVALDFVTKMRSYAMVINDMDLYNNLNYTKSSLENLINADFIAAMTTILNNVTALQPNLVAYGILPATITGFETLFTEYQTSAPLPKISSDEKKAATAGIKASIAAGNELLVKLDGVVRTLLFTNPAFVTSYFEARTLIDQPTSVLVVRGQVVDVDGNPLLVTMTCEALGINRKVSKKGGFLIYNAENGTYIFTFTRTGYETVTQEVQVYNGIRTEVLVVMHRHASAPVEP